MLEGLFVTLFWSLAAAQTSPASGEWKSVPEACFEIRVIVSQENPVEELSSKSLDRIFLKRKKHWDGWEKPITPVNRRVGTPLREVFTESIHGRSVSSIESYWQRRIFSGRGAPPDVLLEDREVLDYIAANPGAISYVSCEAELTSEVKVVRILESAENLQLAQESDAPEKPSFLRLEVITFDDAEGDLQIVRFGICGAGGEHVYVRNLSLEQSRFVRIESTMQRYRRVRARSHAEYTLATGERRFLGCSRPIADSKVSFKIAEGSH